MTFHQQQDSASEGAQATGRARHDDSQPRIGHNAAARRSRHELPLIVSASPTSSATVS